MENKNGKPFREFLENSVGLMTVFGILNALFIFSSNYRNSGSFQFLGIGFFVISIVVWVEIILFALDYSDHTWRYNMFYLMACLVSIGLGWLFIEVFKTYLAVGLVAVLFFGFMLLVIFLTVFLTKKLLRNVSDKKFKNIIFIAILSGIVVSGLLMKSVSKYVQPVTNRFLEFAIDSTDTIQSPK